MHKTEKKEVKCGFLNARIEIFDMVDEIYTRAHTPTEERCSKNNATFIILIHEVRSGF